MLKSILNFQGVEILNREEQRSIKAGDLTWDCQTGDGAVMGQYIHPCIDQPVEIIPAPEFDLP
ncbi:MULTISPECIES: hypothetical protein [Flavobacterium]|uniref:hypothetical protein n=1 Tax=Flavobacterium TaxID=237 RepID=UPI00202F3B20|nr:hypothetical protein [Flavobacterium tyrosinilyticum]MCM0667146.1 hypothetical protein [Flavobacterium tyrosinilyticum]